MAHKRKKKFEPQILFIDSDHYWQRHHESDFVTRPEVPQVVILREFNIHAAEQSFLSNPDIKLVVIDGCINIELVTINGEKEEVKSFDALPLIEKIMQKYAYKGDMLAVETVHGLREQMVQAGCNMSCTKSEIRTTVYNWMRKVQARYFLRTQNDYLAVKNGQEIKLYTNISGVNSEPAFKVKSLNGDILEITLGEDKFQQPYCLRKVSYYELNHDKDWAGIVMA